MARDLIGGSATVNAGDPAEAWNVRAATFGIAPGGQVVNVVATGSTLNFNGGTVGAAPGTPSVISLDVTTSTATLSDTTVSGRAVFNAGSSVTITGSTFTSTAPATESAVIVDGATLTMTDSTINSSAGRGLMVGGTGTNGPGAGRAQVTLINTSVVGGQIAAAGVGNGSTLRLEGSQVTGTVANGAGVFFGLLEAAAGTRIAGVSNGVYLASDTRGTATPGNEIGLILDDTAVSGGTGAGILVTRQIPSQPTAAEIDIRNGSTVTGGNGNLLEVTRTAAANVRVDGSDLVGNVLVDAVSTGTLSLRNNASLTGAMTNATSVSLADTSRWNITGDSTVGALDIGSGTLAFAAPSPDYKTVTVGGDLAVNGGTLIFNSVLAGDDAPSDKLVINGNTSGNGSIAVNNIGGAGAQTTNGIQLISVAGASGASFALAGRATAGVYEYLLYKGGVTNPADGGWYLRSAFTGDPCDLNPSLPICGPVTPIDPVDPVDPVNPVDPVAPVDPIIPDPINPIPILRPEPGAYLANQAAAVRMFQQRRHDRGEPAFEHDRAGAWARVSRDQLHTTIAGQVDARGHTNALQIGSDLVRWGQDGRGQIGVMLATGEATTQAISRITGYGTQGKVKGDAIGVYGTWVQQPDQSGGLYVDGWLQYGRYDSEVKGNGLMAEKYDATTRAASLEAGYGFALSSTERRALYLQPQVQVTYTDYKGDTLQEANGTIVQDDRAGGLESRVGLRLFGQDLITANRVQPFFALNWLYSERGDAMRFDGERLDAQLPTNRYEAQAGAQLRLGERWSAWGDLRVQRGDSGYRDAGAQIGLRRAW